MLNIVLPFFVNILSKENHQHSIFIDFLLKLSPLMDLSNQAIDAGNLSSWPIQSCLNQELFTFHSAQHHSVTTVAENNICLGCIYWVTTKYLLPILCHLRRLATFDQLRHAWWDKTLFYGTAISPIKDFIILQVVRILRTSPGRYSSKTVSLPTENVSNKISVCAFCPSQHLRDKVPLHSS